MFNRWADSDCRLDKAERVAAAQGRDITQKTREARLRLSVNLLSAMSRRSSNCGKAWMPMPTGALKEADENCLPTLLAAATLSIDFCLDQTWLLGFKV